jgi:hypothetical protein
MIDIAEFNNLVLRPIALHAGNAKEFGVLRPPVSDRVPPSR